MKYLPIQGTDSWSWDVKGEWWQNDSPFTKYMATKGFQLLRPDNPFVWSTDLNGTHFWLRWLHKKTHKDRRDWQAGGHALRYYLDPAGCEVPYIDRNLIAHSHGLQVVLYACAQGLRIRRLVTVGSPIREDVINETIAAAKPNIGYWLHIHGADEDKIQIAGEFGDGHVGPVRNAYFADMNVQLAGVDHSHLLRQPDAFHYWEDQSLLDFIRLPLATLKGQQNAGPECK